MLCMLPYAAHVAQDHACVRQAWLRRLHGRCYGVAGMIKRDGAGDAAGMEEAIKEGADVDAVEPGVVKRPTVRCSRCPLTRALPCCFFGQT